VLVRGGDPGRLVAELAAGDPSVRAFADGDALVFCTDALTAPDVDEIGAALASAW
jgi:hypothetical protein